MRLIKLRVPKTDLNVHDWKALQWVRDDNISRQGLGKFEQRGKKLWKGSGAELNAGTSFPIISGTSLWRNQHSILLTCRSLRRRNVLTGAMASSTEEGGGGCQYLWELKAFVFWDLSENIPYSMLDGVN